MTADKDRPADRVEEQVAPMRWVMIALVFSATVVNYLDRQTLSVVAPFLIEQFGDSGLTDPGDPNHGIDLNALARGYIESYAKYKSAKKSSGNLDIRKIPGVNHPVFKDKPVNVDPREVFIRELLAARGEYNVFHDFYRTLVQRLFDAGVSRNVYCVNIDAVIAALLLKMLWRPYRDGQLSSSALETAAFTIFLYPRMLGCAAEVDDHLNRGRNMDTRTPASQCQFVA